MKCLIGFSLEQIKPAGLLMFLLKVDNEVGEAEMLTVLYLRRVSVPLVKAWMVTVARRIMRNSCLTTSMR